MAKFLRSTPVLLVLGLAMAVQVYLSFATPIGGSFGDVVTLAMNDVTDHVPVKATLLRTTYDSNGSKYIYAQDLYGQSAAVKIASPMEISVGQAFVADMSYDRATAGIYSRDLIRKDPGMTFPLIQGLGELGRNMLFHVPMSMVAFIAFLVGTIFSIMYLVKKDPDYDRRARASSAAALLFTTLATVTGSIWARFSWGTFWNWDPRETSIFILLLIYIAYFILRSMLEESEDKKARVAAVYNIIAFVSVPFLMFVLPRITQSLHPGGGGTEAPIINVSGKTHTDRTLLNMHWISTFLFGMVYVWIQSLYTRILKIEDARED